SWSKQKRLASPAFSRASLARMGPRIVAAAEEFVRERTAAPGAPLNILDEMRRLILKITGLLLFSTDLTPHADVVFRALGAAFGSLHGRMDAPLFRPEWPWSRARRTFLRTKQELDGLVQGVIAARRERREAAEDVLDCLGAPDPQTGRPMPERQLK